MRRHGLVHQQTTILYSEFIGSIEIEVWGRTSLISLDRKTGECNKICYLLAEALTSKSLSSRLDLSPGACLLLYSDISAATKP